MLIFLFKVLIAIIIGFLTINLALFIWRVLTPFARMYYKDSYGNKSYFGYLRNTASSNDAKIIDSGRVIGDKEIGDTTNDGKIFAKTNNQYLGYVNLSGEIFDKNNQKIAECNPNGKRDWRYLWLMHRTEVEYVYNTNKQNTGYCTESLRFGQRKTSEITLLAKSAAALVLFEDYIHAEEGKRAEASTGASDLAFPAAILFTICYVGIYFLMTHYQMFPALGVMLSYVAGMLVIYFLIWWTLYMIKTDFAYRNVSFSVILSLINRNTGIKGWNFWLTLLSVAGIVSCIWIHGYVFVPLFVVILIGTAVNWIKQTSAPWEVLQPSNSVWIPKKRETNREKVKTYGHTQQTTTKTIVRKEFKWEIPDLNIADADKKFDVELYKEDFDDANPEIREKNPFYGKDANGKENWQNAVGDLHTSIQTILKGSNTITENTEEKALLKIINSAYNICNKYHLADYELYELLLSFCQNEILYKLDEESAPILKAKEYVRFPIENLYDKEGDCDCKASLAYGLFKLLKVDVRFAIVTSKDDGGKHAAILVKKDTGKVKLPNKFSASIPGFPDYAYCEATGSGWEFGAIPADIDVNTIEVI